MCVYTGECMKCMSGNKSRYILTGKWWNHTTSEFESWHLDSAHPNNGAARYINDCIGTEWEGLYNVKFRVTVSNEPHPVCGKFYVKVIVCVDIKAGEELFVEYTSAYWSRFFT